MKQYRVILTKTQVLNFKDVVAESKAKAIDLAMPIFHKIDIDDYEDVVVEELDEEEVD